MPVVRVPIAGPSPFNTLVIVSDTNSESIPRVPPDGRLHTGALTVGTQFVLAGPPGQRTRPSLVPHSTAVTLRRVSQSDDTSFTYAVDAVSGRFDTSGGWWLDITTAALVDGERAEILVSYCSWVLCTEPSV